MASSKKRSHSDIETGHQAGPATDSTTTPGIDNLPFTIPASDEILEEHRALGHKLLDFAVKCMAKNDDDSSVPEDEEMEENEGVEEDIAVEEEIEEQKEEEVKKEEQAEVDPENASEAPVMPFPLQRPVPATQPVFSPPESAFTFTMNMQAPITSPGPGPRTQPIISPCGPLPFTSALNLQAPVIFSPPPRLALATQPTVFPPGPAPTSTYRSFDFRMEPFSLGNAATQKARANEDTLAAEPMRSPREHGVQRLVERLKERNELKKERDEALETKEKAIKTETGRVEAYWNTKSARLNSYITELEERCRGKQGEVDQAQQRAKDEMKKTAKVSDDLKQYEELLSKTEETKEGVEADKIRLTTDLRSARDREKTLRLEKQELDKRLQEASTTTTVLSEKIASLERTKDERLSNLEIDNQSLITEVKTLRNSVDEKCKNNKRLETHLYKDATTNTGIEKASLEKEVEEQNKALATENKEYRKYVDRKVREVNILKTNNENLNREIAGLTRDLEIYRAEQPSFKDASTNTITFTHTTTAQPNAEPKNAPPQVQVFIVKSRPSIDIILSGTLLVFLSILLAGFYIMGMSERSHWVAANAATRRVW